ncbi:MAG: hypothetical protein FJ123_00995 [Deltaproteobacteria bacterium]|nr:hypothetical protein [Deltaproteobacteria bacterium]
MTYKEYRRRYIGKRGDLMKQEYGWHFSVSGAAPTNNALMDIQDDFAVFTDNAGKLCGAIPLNLLCVWEYDISWKDWGKG